MKIQNVNDASFKKYGKILKGYPVDKILKERKTKWQPKTPKYQKGVLALYTEHAVSPMKGGYMK